MDATPNPDQTDAATETRLAALEAELGSLRAELATSRSQPVQTSTSPEPEASPTRRMLLGGVAAGAAATIVGVLAGAEPAAATTGAMQFGTGNDSGTANTSLTSASTNSTLLVANSGTGDGVVGTSVTDSGVAGSSTNAVGVDGNSFAGTGIRAQTTQGKALSVLAVNALGTEILSNRTQLRLTHSGTRNAPTSDAFSHFAGDLTSDSAGNLWHCVATGTPGTWRKLSGPSATGAFHVLPVPVRVYDSRPFSQPAVGLKTPLAGSEIRSLSTTVNSSTVPTDASAVMVTVLLVNAVAGNGNFTIWADGAPRPSSNTMVWGGSTGRFSTTTVTAMGPAAKVQVSSSLKTDLVLDVIGYYR